MNKKEIRNLIYEVIEEEFLDENFDEALFELEKAIKEVMKSSIVPKDSPHREQLTVYLKNIKEISYKGVIVDVSIKDWRWDKLEKYPDEFISHKDLIKANPSYSPENISKDMIENFSASKN